MDSRQVRTRAQAAGRELALWAFAGTATYLAAGFYWYQRADCTSTTMKLLMAGAAVVPVALRHRFPATGLLIAAVLFGWCQTNTPVFALAAYFAARNVAPARRRAAVLAGAVLITLVAGLTTWRFSWQITAAVCGIATLVCVVVPTMTQAMLGQRERLIEALRDQTGYLRSNQLLAASSARLTERSRIAQEMHDLLGHRLSLISLYTGALELEAVHSRPLADQARLIRSTVRTAMDELRTTLGILRHSGPGADPEQPADHVGTRADAQRLVEQARRAGLRVTLVWTGDDLAGHSPPVRQAVHRIIREGLTNVCGHAAGAGTVVSVSHYTDEVVVEVADDGNGNATCADGLPHTGSGLVGVQERVRLLGGTFHAGPTSAAGFLLRARIPRDARPGGAEPPAETEAPRGDAQRGERWVRAGLASVPGFEAITATAVLLLTFNMVPGADQDHEMSFADIPLGVSSAVIRAETGGDDPVARQAAGAIEPAKPAADDCWYSFYYADAMGSAVTFERYCFRQDRLVEKVRFILPPR